MNSKISFKNSCLQTNVLSLASIHGQYFAKQSFGLSMQTRSNCHCQFDDHFVVACKVQIHCRYWRVTSTQQSLFSSPQVHAERALLSFCIPFKKARETDPNFDSTLLHWIHSSSTLHRLWRSSVSFESVQSLNGSRGVEISDRYARFPLARD